MVESKIDDQQVKDVVKEEENTIKNKTTSGEQISGFDNLDKSDDILKANKSHKPTEAQAKDGKAKIENEEVNKVDEIKNLQNELSKAKDESIRAAAEIENVKKRARKDIENAARFGLKQFAEEIVLVKDNLDRAIEAVTEEDKKDKKVSNLVSGIKMTEELFLSTLKKFGIKEINPKGERFNPDLHQAVSMVSESKGEAPGTVTKVVQPGYILNDRLIRPAMVIVAK